MQLTLLILYLATLVYTIVTILLNTRSTPKTLAYLLLILAVPGLGIIIYFSIGINFRHHKSNSAGVKAQNDVDEVYLNMIPDESEQLLQFHKEEIDHYESLVRFIHNAGDEHLSQNRIKLLVNGEEKFPEVLKTLDSALHFIHMEYYDWENDTRGNQIKDILLKKAASGIKVKVLYDDYASRKIRHNIVQELKKGGVEIYPKIKVRFRKLANRVNHRDHRKVIIVDGNVGYVGGINISDRYDNSIDTGLYWRDTHAKIEGPLAKSMQRHFIVSWNLACSKKMAVEKELFPDVSIDSSKGALVLSQIVAGGPIYPKSNIMMTYFHAFSLAKNKLYVTNPYFIPSESIMNSLEQAAISGVDVRLMVPYKSDSAIVGAASRFYFSELLYSGVRIFLYKKGFVHAKTVVADTKLSIVGTANMDIRSFDLNFEIMSVNYGGKFAAELEKLFIDDLKECVEITQEDWSKIGMGKKLIYSIARLISAFL